MSEYLLEVENLVKYFGPVKAVDNVSFRINRGMTFGLVGESGCGKTTLGRTILMLHQPTSGNVYLKTSLDKNLSEMKFNLSSGKDIRRLRRKMQIVYQDPASSIDPRMLIREVIAEPLKFYKVFRGEKLWDRVTELLKLVGLQEEHLWRYPFELSGGQRQRVAIARAIALNPELLVLDEPTSALDVSVQAKTLKLLKKIQKEFNLTYLFITHDISVIDYMCDRVGVMYLGKIVENAEKDKLLEKPLHPYTQALLSAIPSLNPTKKNLEKATILQGEVGSPINLPLGCRFHPRCKYAFEKCGWSSTDLTNYLQENLFGKVKISFNAQGFHLEIKADQGEDVKKVNAIVSDLINKGKEQKLPLFQAIRVVELVDESDKKQAEIHIHFNEVKEPELFEVEGEHYVACYLYN